MRAAPLIACAILCGVACEQEAPAPVQPTQERRGDTAGTAVPVDPGLPQGHPPVAFPLDDPQIGGGHVGRAPRRVDVGQLRQSFVTALGTSWVTARPQRAGSFDDFDAPAEVDMFEYFAENLGRADYSRRTAEANDPSIPFTKLVNDGARYVCRQVVTRDPMRPAAERKIFIHVTERDTAAAAPDAVRRNLAELALRFWSLDVPSDDPVVDGLFALFRTASERPSATPSDGWRVVCIDLVTDPRFLTY